MGQVLDMAGNELAVGHSGRSPDDLAYSASLQEVWFGAQEFCRLLADHHGIGYPDAAAMLVHSLLREAERDSDRHDTAGELLKFIRESFFDEEASDESE